MFKKLILVCLTMSLLYSSEIKDLNDQVYDAATRSGIVVVEYWASWNIDNRIDLESMKIKDAKVYRLNIEQYPGVQSKNNVIVVPTIIFYDEGEEVNRLQGDLTFTLDVSQKKIQKIIDEILMSKF